MLVDLFVPAIVVLLMTLVGIGLMPAQFIAVLRAPVALLGGTLLQYLLLPLGAAAIFVLFQFPLVALMLWRHRTARRRPR